MIAKINLSLSQAELALLLINPDTCLTSWYSSEITQKKQNLLFDIRRA
jgi:hypothetical protein